MNGNASDIDLSQNASPVRFAAQYGIVLATQIVVAAPPDLEPRGRAMLARVVQKKERVTEVMIARSKTSTGGLRPCIAALDAAYGALHGRLSSASKMPASIGDFGARATAILDAVLVDGVAFLVNDAETKYAESARRLQVIEAQRLEREIDRIAGVGFLEAVKVAHAAFGEALGMGSTPVRYARAELQEAVNELAVAIADYCLQLAAQVDRYDAESVARYRAAMMPMDRFRAERASSGAGDDEEDEPVLTPTPVTPVIGTPGVPGVPGPFITNDAE